MLRHYNAINLNLNVSGCYLLLKEQVTATSEINFDFRIGDFQ